MATIVATTAAMDNLLLQLHQRRVVLGLVDLPEEDTDIRIRALDKLNADQFLALLELPDEPRMRQIHAMELGQRHQHGLVDLRAVARSAVDDRFLYRWWCACGVEAPGDYYGGLAARAGWEMHAGIAGPIKPEPAPGAEQRECAWEGCRRGPGETRRVFVVRADRERQRWCCTPCREADRAGQAPRARLFGTEE